MEKLSNFGENAGQAIGNSSSSKTATLLAATKFRCEVCQGLGHEYYECPTKRKLDKWAKNNGDSANWGQWKYEKYYSNLSEEKREFGKKQAA